MRKLLVALLFTTMASAQVSYLPSSKDDFRAYVEVVGLNYGDFTETNYVLDVQYDINEDWYLSSWNTRTVGRQEWQGFDYSILSGFVNYKLGRELILSAGYQELQQHSFNLKANALVLKFRLKLL